MKTVYQKYIKTSARVSYAPPAWKRAQVQTTDFHSKLILLSAGVVSRKYFRYIVNDCVKRKAPKCIPLMTGKMNLYALLTYG